MNPGRSPVLYPNRHVVPGWRRARVSLAALATVLVAALLVPAGAPRTASAQSSTPMTFGSVSLSGSKWTTGTPVGTALPPVQQGGVPPYTYSFIPALPPGVFYFYDPVWDAVEIYGTPTASRAPTPYIYRATDSIGNTVELISTIEVKPAMPTNLTTTGGDGKVTLVWDDPMDAGRSRWTAGTGRT